MCVVSVEANKAKYNLVKTWIDDVKQVNMVCNFLPCNQKQLFVAFLWKDNFAASKQPTLECDTRSKWWLSLLWFLHSMIYFSIAFYLIQITCIWGTFYPRNSNSNTIKASSLIYLFVRITNDINNYLYI